MVLLHTRSPVGNALRIFMGTPIKLTESPETPGETAENMPESPAKGEDSRPAIRAKPFPEPPKSTLKHGTIPLEKFWRYRKDLPKQFHDRLVFFVYREWPVLDFYKSFTAEEMAEMRAHKKRRPIKYIAKYTDIDPDDWRNHLLRFHGSGIYKILLNDAGVRGDKKLVDGAQVCSTTIELRDDEFSPVVDLAVLDMTDPANSSFINDLRMKGVVLPGDKRPEGDDVAASEAVAKLTDALVKQSETKTPDNTAANMLSELLRQSEERHQRAAEAAESRHVRDMEAVTKRLEAAEASAKTAPSTTQEVIAMAQAIMPKVAPPTEDKMTTLLMAMLQSEKTARIEEMKLVEARLQADKTAHVEEMKLADGRHVRELEALTKRLEAMDARESARIQKLESAPAASAVDQGNTFKSVIGALEGLNKLKERMVGDTDGGGTGNPWVDGLAPFLPQVLDTINNGISAFKAPPPMNPMPQQQPAQQLPQGQQQQQPQQQDNSEMGQMAMYARMIRGPLIQCLSSNPPTPGHRFAGLLINQYGEPAYNYLCQQGADGVLAILQAAPEVWGDVQRFGQKVPKFLEEFLNAPAAMEQAQMIRAGQGQRPTTPASTPASEAVVDSAPAATDPRPPGGRTIIRGDGTPMRTNGPITEPSV